jgi:hypothetical protein
MEKSLFLLLFFNRCLAHRATDSIILYATNVLKSKTMPGPKSHNCTMKQAFLNQLAQSCLKPACTNLSPTVVMEEGCQKSKRLLCTEKFKHQVIHCTKKGHHKATAIFGVYESNVQLRREHNTAFSACDGSKKKFTAPN